MQRPHRNSPVVVKHPRTPRRGSGSSSTNNNKKNDNYSSSNRKIKSSSPRPTGPLPSPPTTATSSSAYSRYYPQQTKKQQKRHYHATKNGNVDHRGSIHSNATHQAEMMDDDSSLRCSRTSRTSTNPSSQLYAQSSSLSASASRSYSDDEEYNQTFKDNQYSYNNNGNHWQYYTCCDSYDTEDGDNSFVEHRQERNVSSTSNHVPSPARSLRKMMTKMLSTPTKPTTPATCAPSPPPSPSPALPKYNNTPLNYRASNIDAVKGTRKRFSRSSPASSPKLMMSPKSTSRVPEKHHHQQHHNHQRHHHYQHHQHQHQHQHQQQEYLYHPQQHNYSQQQHQQDQQNQHKQKQKHRGSRVGGSLLRLVRGGSTTTSGSSNTATKATHRRTRSAGNGSGSNFDIMSIFSMSSHNSYDCVSEQHPKTKQNSGAGSIGRLVAGESSKRHPSQSLSKSTNSGKHRRTRSAGSFSMHSADDILGGKAGMIIQCRTTAENGQRIVYNSSSSWNYSDDDEDNRNGGIRADQIYKKKKKLQEGFGAMKRALSSSSLNSDSIMKTPTDKRPLSAASFNLIPRSSLPPYNSQRSSAKVYYPTDLLQPELNHAYSAERSPTAPTAEAIEAAVSIQRYWRGYDARQSCLYKKIQIQISNEAIKIQTRWRMKLSKYVVEEKRITRDYTDRAPTRNNVTLMKEAVIKIQSITRGYMQRLSYKVCRLERKYNDILSLKEAELMQIQSDTISSKRKIYEEEEENLFLTETLQHYQEIILKIKVQNGDLLQEIEQYAKDVKHLNKNINELYNKLLSQQFMNKCKKMEISQIQDEYVQVQERFEMPYKEELGLMHAEYEQVVVKGDRVNAENEILQRYIDEMNQFITNNCNIDFDADSVNSEGNP